MGERTKDNDDTAIDWLFSKAGKLPLLTAAQEQAIDSSKWGALAEVQRLCIEDDSCRHYLGLWANNVLNNPPTLEEFAIREHYYLLRREQVGLLKGGEQRDALAAFSKYIRGPVKKSRDLEAIMALRLPAGLVVGLGETIADETVPRGVAAALHYWHNFWPTPPGALWDSENSQTRNAIREYLADYYTVREQLVNHNLRLVFSIAGGVADRGVPYRDLIQNGVIGLIRAAEKFEYKKGYRFSTYAYNWISQSLRHTIEDLRGIIRYPSGVNDQISRMHRERIHLFNSNGGEPDQRTLARRLKMKPEALDRLQQVGNLSISLDATSFDDTEGLALGEKLSGGPFTATAGEAEQRSLNRCLMQKIQQLEPTEQKVVIQRWGLERTPPLTRAEIAGQMQVSTEWVRQLEVSALAKLRNDKQVAQVYRDHQGIEN